MENETLRTLPEFKIATDYPSWMAGTDGSVFEFCDGEWRRVEPSQNQDGYLTVTLVNETGKRSVGVHVLILETFVGPRPYLSFACHAPDVDPTNNRLENLRWGTGLDNRNDMLKHGRNPRRKAVILYGKNKRDKPQGEDKAAIRMERARGYSIPEIAKMRGIEESRVAKILGITTWARA